MFLSNVSVRIQILSLTVTINMDIHIICNVNKRKNIRERKSRNLRLLSLSLTTPCANKYQTRIVWSTRSRRPHFLSPPPSVSKIYPRKIKENHSTNIRSTVPFDFSPNKEVSQTQCVCVFSCACSNV